MQEEVAEKSMVALLPADVFSWRLPSGLGPLPTEDHTCLGVGVGPRQRVPSSERALWNIRF